MIRVMSLRPRGKGAFILQTSIPTRVHRLETFSERIDRWWVVRHSEGRSELCFSGEIGRLGCYDIILNNNTLRLLNSDGDAMYLERLK
jgi:hypothetical protein